MTLGLRVGHGGRQGGWASRPIIRGQIGIDSEAGSSRLFYNTMIVGIVLLGKIALAGLMTISRRSGRSASSRVSTRAWLAVVVLARAHAAQSPAALETRSFEIRRDIFRGASLIPQAEFERRTRLFTGKARTAGDVQHALEAVARAYSDAGYNAVQVVLPDFPTSSGGAETGGCALLRYSVAAERTDLRGRQGWRTP